MTPEYGIYEIVHNRPIDVLGDEYDREGKTHPGKRKGIEKTWLPGQT